MGVPSLFRWITNKYPQILEKDTMITECDCLYVDFNAIIHISCVPTDGPTPNTEEEMFQNIQRNLEVLVKKCKPKKLLYISTDGVAPRSKMNQQRARRFSASMEALKNEKKYFKEHKNENLVDSVGKVLDDAKNVGIIQEQRVTVPEKEENFDFNFKESDDEGVEKEVKINDVLDLSSSSINEVFDKNAITPGTPFMAKLEDNMCRMIMYKLSTDDLWKNLKIIYSSDRVPGEGEQKILSYLRKLNESKGKQKHIIFSPDGDLVFLGLSQHNRNLRIMREDLDFANLKKRDHCDLCEKNGHKTEYCGILKLYSCVYININTLRNSLISEFQVTIKHKFFPTKIINDFIFLSFFAGNDFLPTLPCFDVRFEAIEELMKLLAENFNNTKLYLTENYNVNFQSLSNFFSLLARSENKLYYIKRKNLIATRRKFRSPEGEVLPLEIESGKTIYYQIKLKVKDDRELTSVCNTYIRGLAWVFRYYMKDTDHWDYYYNNDYAPFARDLARIKYFKTNFSNTEPLHPLEQAMLVLPPLSSDLVPEPLRTIYTEYKEYYPSEIKIDMFDKLMPWQAIVLLPEVNVKKIIMAVKNKSKELSIKDTYRNVKSKDLIFFSFNHNSFEKIKDMYFQYKNNLKVTEPILEYIIKRNPHTFLPDTKMEYNGKEFQNKSISGIFELKN
ncbi:5'- 3'exoribonuclease [Spraguea lophii 42_110]|uniref:5'-3'exoribonuclease n=1 Tax=Spraguea lophii (strain 42_110) TaxID=1358809 RepID=S7XIZ0_SPRLO|nr:5'- 3'exoribonuclease [Spraguea lophii 42_110]